MDTDIDSRYGKWFNTPDVNRKSGKKRDCNRELKDLEKSFKSQAPKKESPKLIEKQVILP